VWQLFQQYGTVDIKSAIGGIDAVYPALAASVFSLIAVSLLTFPPSAEQLSALDATKIQTDAN
jgi:hypothetical protein